MTNIEKHIQIILKKVSELTLLDEKINAIASYAKLITGARRFSLFVFDKEESQLVSLYSDGINEGIILKSDIGLVGYAFHKKRSILENDTEHNPLFYKSIDEKFDFATRNILAIPIISKDNKSIGVIQLLNKKIGFNKDDQAHIEALVPFISSLLIAENAIPNYTTPKKVSNLELVQKNFNTYLEDKHLYLMEDGHAYYKLLNMKRDYFIGADSCYQLTVKPTSVNLFYYTNNEENKEFLSHKVSAMIDHTKAHILISETATKDTFTHYPLEKES